MSLSLYKLCHDTTNNNKNIIKRWFLVSALNETKKNWNLMSAYEAEMSDIVAYERKILWRENMVLGTKTAITCVMQ